MALKPLPTSEEPRRSCQLSEQFFKNFNQLSCKLDEYVPGGMNPVTRQDTPLMSNPPLSVGLRPNLSMNKIPAAYEGNSTNLMTIIHKFKLNWPKNFKDSAPDGDPLTWSVGN